MTDAFDEMQKNLDDRIKKADSKEIEVEDADLLFEVAEQAVHALGADPYDTSFNYLASVLCAIALAGDTILSKLATRAIHYTKFFNYIQVERKNFGLEEVPYPELLKEYLTLRESVQGGIGYYSSQGIDLTKKD